MPCAVPRPGLGGCGPGWCVPSDPAPGGTAPALRPDRSEQPASNRAAAPTGASRSGPSRRGAARRACRSRRTPQPAGTGRRADRSSRSRYGICGSGGTNRQEIAKLVGLALIVQEGRTGKDERHTKGGLPRRVAAPGRALTLRRAAPAADLHHQPDRGHSPADAQSDQKPRRFSNRTQRAAPELSEPIARDWRRR